MLFPPARVYVAMMRRLRSVVERIQQRRQFYNALAIDTRSVVSKYLAGKSADRRFVEIILYFQYHQSPALRSIMDELVREVDDLCVELGAFRYMTTRTSRDDERLRRIDPNAQYTTGESLGRTPPGWSVEGAKADAASRPVEARST